MELEVYALETKQGLLTPCALLVVSAVLLKGVAVAIGISAGWYARQPLESPVGPSAVVLAAVMLKLGGYGFLRLSLPIVPDASLLLAPVVIALSLIAVVYIGLVALVQTDMKKLIAYSSISHMGFVTLGVFIVAENDPAPPAELSSPGWTHGDLMLAEQFIAGRELTCAVMGDRPLDVIEILAADGGWYDYNAKYAKGGSKHVLPANLKPNIYQDIQQLALEAHRALGCRGVSRADFRYDDRPGGTGELVVLEVNTQPGMTETSLVPEMAAYAGFSFGELVQWMVEDASCNR